RDPLRFDDVARARIVGGGVARRVLILIVNEGPVASAQRGAHVIVARRQAVDAISTRVVALISTSGRCQPSSALHHLIPQHLHASVCHSIAELVEYAPGDRGTARQREVSALHDLAVRKIYWCSTLESALLTVPHGHETSLGCSQIPSSCGKILELEPPL